MGEPVMSYPQDSMDLTNEQTDKPLRIYHAPFSLFHMSSRDDGNSKLFLWDNMQPYYLPKTEEIHREELNAELNQNMARFPIDTRTRLILGYKDIMERYDGLYGEYFPQSYERTVYQPEDGKSVHPVKYFTNFLLQQKLENIRDEKKLEIVVHPDILFFASRGEKQRIPEILKYLNGVAGILNMKLFFENASFDNPKFKDAFSSFEKPWEMWEMVKDYPQLGLVVDLEHIERSGFENGQVTSVVSGIQRERLIVHAREDSKAKHPDTYLHCVRNGIPWVVED